MGQKYSIGTYPEESQRVRCPVFRNNKCCSNYVLRFDASGAKSHQGLIRVIGNGDSVEASKIIDQKFDELEIRLDHFHNLTPCKQAVIGILFFIPLVNLIMLCGHCYHIDRIDKIIQSNFADWKEFGVDAVSYTHLTLQTKA